MQKITLIQPDDWHCHLRDEIYLTRTVPDIARNFARAIVMPNLVPPLTTVEQASQYLQRIKAHIPAQKKFTPLLTLYLTADTTPEIITTAKSSHFIAACKLYPAGATTHSEAGIQNIHSLYPIFEAMQTHNLPLLIHGEVTDNSIDIDDREAVFIDTHLIPLQKKFPALRIVLEHISTRYAVEFIQSNSLPIAATITPHHMLLNRNDLLVGGIKPHYYCLPIVKRREDQEALIKAAISGSPKFFLGTDSAPHTQQTKENACGCAGIYSAYTAIEIYAEIFAQQNALDKLENFASYFGPQFYQLPINTNRITLVKKAWQIPEILSFGQEKVIPFLAGKTLNWQLEL